MEEKWKALTSLFGMSALLTSTLLGCAPEIVFEDEHPGDGDGDSASGGQVGDGDGDAAGGNGAGGGVHTGGTAGGTGSAVSWGARPYYLIDQMDEGDLKDDLRACEYNAAQASTFSIGHRGAALQFPEHTEESYRAAAHQGAGIIECDVTFTKDKELVCRHSQCDLHTTTNILLTDLADKCTQGFIPAELDADGKVVTPASAQCCTSDITLEEFQTLCGKMDGANSASTTVEGYVDGTADFRTDLYSTCGTLVTHAESIALIASVGAKFTPELKSASVSMPFDGFSQEDYAQKMIDEYVTQGVDPKDVWAQSFNVEDVYYWIDHEPSFGEQAVFLDDVDSEADLEAAMDNFSEMRERGVRIVAPPLWALVTEKDGEIVPSRYAKKARKNGFDLITWTLERSGPLASGGGWYFQSVADLTDDDGVTFELLHVLARDVGVIGVFSDWPSTVTYYANCFGL